MKFTSTLLTLTTAALTFVGCAGYQLGSSVPQDLRSIHVSAFENNTVYPMVASTATQHTMTAIVHDGTFSLDDLNKATLRLTGSVDGITTKAISYDQSNAALPDEYLVGIKAKIYLYNTLTGEMLINGKTIKASTYMLTRGEMQTAVVDIIPTLSAKLSENILSQLHTIGEPKITPKAEPVAEEPAAPAETTPAEDATATEEEPFQPTVIDPNVIYPTPNPICSCQRGTIHDPACTAEAPAVVEEPVVEAPTEEPAPAVEEAPVAEEATPVEDVAPVVEETPAVEAVVETPAPVVEEPAPAVEAPVVETPAEEPAPAVEEAAPVEVEKPAEVKNPVKEEKPVAKDPDQALMDQLLITE